jgi:hypothetical protein
MKTQIANGKFCNAQTPKEHAARLLPGGRFGLACLLLAGMMTALAGAQARPVNFRQVGQGQAVGNGVLHFDYSWASSTGNLDNLGNCEVGESVAYPGANPYVWTSPPYAQNGGTRNPTVLWVPATDGEAQDNHRHFGFLRPYRADNFTATQDYRWRCTNINGGRITDFANFTGIQIVRTVANTMRNPQDNCWFYTIIKSAAMAQVRPLPNAGPCQAIRRPVVDLASPEASRSQTSGSGVWFSPASSTTTLHEPMFLQFVISNQLADSVQFDLGVNRTANFEVVVTGPDGKTLARRLDSGGFGRSGELSLGAGETFASTLLLNQWNDFAAVGDYKVKITLLGAVTSLHGEALADHPSQELYVQVEPRDAQRLTQICGDLADAAITAPTMSERMEAAETLSYVNDPVAVPHLIRVLNQGTFVEQYAVEGLGRIASPQAIGALWGAMTHPDPDVRSLAYFTLSHAGQVAQQVPKPMD